MPAEGDMPHSIALVVWTVPAYRTPWPEWRTSPSVPPCAAARAIGRGMHLPVSAYGHEEIRVDPEDVARQRLAARPHAADGTRFEHAAAARRDGPAVQRFGRCPADRPDLCVCSIESGPCERVESLQMSGRF